MKDKKWTNYHSWKVHRQINVRDQARHKQLMQNQFEGTNFI
jgi:hypothetical protein